MKKLKINNYLLMTLITLFVTCVNINSLIIKANGIDETNNSIINNAIENLDIEDKELNLSTNKVTNISSTLKESILYTNIDEKPTSVVINKTSIKKTETKEVNKNDVLNLKSEDFVLTFYTSLSEENSGYEGLNAYGDGLEYGQIASNYYPKGTLIRLEGIGMFEVTDTGGSDFDSKNRIDVFVPRISGENNSDYKDRVLALGKLNAKGYVLN